MVCPTGAKNWHRERTKTFRDMLCTSKNISHFQIDVGSNRNVQDDGFDLIIMLWLKSKS